MVWHRPGNPTKGVFLPNPHEGPYSQPTLLEIQALQTVSLSPTNTQPRGTKFGAAFQWRWSTESKTTRISGTRRSDSGKFRELSTTSSRVQTTSALTSLAVRTSTGNGGWTIAAPLAIKSSAKGCSQSRTTGALLSLSLLWFQLIIAEQTSMGIQHTPPWCF